MDAFAQDAGILGENPGQERYWFRNQRRQYRIVQNRKKTLTEFQKSYLNELYNEKRYVDLPERCKAAKNLQLTQSDVKRWFKNRRAHDRRHPEQNNEERIAQ